MHRPGNRSRTALAATAAVACGLLAGGCADNGQNTLHTDSPQSHDIAVLFWVMLAVASVVFFGAIAMLVAAWLRRGDTGLPVLGERESLSTRLVVAFGIVLPAVVLVGLFLAANVGVISATAAPKPSSTKLTVRIIGHQWWWEVRYPGHAAVTANEIHIPAGTRVDVIGTTADVIHSFWVPQLNRKIDTVPGRENRVLLYARTPGRYRGQCAEFCGLQHTHMSFWVDADPPARFARWLAAESAPAATPPGGEAARGRALFMAAACASCHEIRGTPARALLGPDLTHVASRGSLAALATQNNPRGLLGWITDPQHVKPGAKMPALDLSRADFAAIAAYLRSLR